ncbi:MAG: hypothetical protein WDW38_001861 [Sanguina aurantia]
MVFQPRCDPVRHRWRQQANLTAACVMEAKNDVLERKRELDSTKEKMDRLLDKLYVGRERGIELQSSIYAAQNFGAGSPSVIGKMSQSQQSAMAHQFAAAHGAHAGGAGHHPGSKVPMLPKIANGGGGGNFLMDGGVGQAKQGVPSVMGGMGMIGGVMGGMMMPNGGMMNNMMGGGNGSNGGVMQHGVGMQPGGQGLPQVDLQQQQQQQQGGSPGANAVDYSTVPSKFAAHAEAAGKSAAAARKKVASTKGAKKFDRFEEGKAAAAALHFAGKWS